MVSHDNTAVLRRLDTYNCLCVYCDNRSYFSAQLAGGFTLSHTFWTNRGRRCRPFSPPVHAFLFVAHRVQRSHCSSICIEFCQLAFSHFRPRRRLRKSEKRLRAQEGNAPPTPGSNPTPAASKGDSLPLYLCLVKFPRLHFSRPPLENARAFNDNKSRLVSHYGYFCALYSTSHQTCTIHT